jgi:hypothetical protein
VSEKEHLQGIVRVCKHGQELENILDSSNKPKLLRVAEPGTELLFRSTVKGAQRQQARVRKKKGKTYSGSGWLDGAEGWQRHPTDPPHLLPIKTTAPVEGWWTRDTVEWSNRA